MSSAWCTRACALAACLALASCGRPAADSPPATSSAPAADAAASTKPHGDHNPRHGGIVMMKGDLHYEVVVDRTGRAHRLFFTDAVRDDLPASIASSATLTIRRPGAAEETIPLRIDEAGESWVGSGKPVEPAPKAMVRVAFTMHDEPYWIDIPLER